MEDKVFVFTVHLTGTGETEEEAWDNAVEQFCIDPGIADSSKEMEEENE